MSDVEIVKQFKEMRNFIFVLQVLTTFTRHTLNEELDCKPRN